MVVIYMYIAPGQGQKNRGVIFFGLTVLFSPNSPLLQIFSH